MHNGLASAADNNRAVAERYREQGWWRSRTFLDDLSEHAIQRPNHPAVIAYEGGKLAHQIGYAELDVFVERFAAALAELGVGRGDTVVIYVPNWWLLAPMYLGCARAGAVAAPAQMEYRGREVGHILQASGAKVCVSADVFDGVDFAGRVAEMAPPTLKHRVVLGGDAGRTGAIDFSAQFVDIPWERERPVTGPGLGPDDPALLVFTSGTTGKPKGVLHSLNTIWSAGNSLSVPYGLTGQDVISIPQQLTHVAGAMHAIYAPVSLGATCVMHDTKADMNLLLEMTERHRITWVHTAPNRLADLLAAQRAAPRDTSSVRLVSSSSAPIPQHMADEVREVFGVELLACWGMTETGGCTTTRPGDPPGWAARSDGRAMPWMDIKVGADPGAGSHGIGRLFVRGASLCLGYFGQPEVFAASVDADGWFDTGDMARPDGRDGIRITGRRADLITRPNGEKVPTSEIEAMLVLHPAIAEAVLIGYPDPQLPDGDAVCAVIAPGDGPDLAEIHAYLDRAEVTRDHWPDRLARVPGLPRNSLGKVQRNELRAAIEAGQL